MKLIPILLAVFMLAACRPDQSMQTFENPRIIIRKAERRLELYDSERLVKSYRMVLGFAPEGDKERSGDGKTPEGEFYVFVKNDKSKYHLSLGVSYPDSADAKRGLEAGLITAAEHDAITQAVAEKRMPPQNTALGGEVYIHGGGASKDWTWGCIALENDEMTEIYNAAKTGMPVTILP